jgi:hypothetical protein
MLIDPMIPPNEATPMQVPILANPCTWVVILILAWNLARGLIG